MAHSSLTLHWWWMYTLMWYQHLNFIVYYPPRFTYAIDAPPPTTNCQLNPFIHRFLFAYPSQDHVLVPQIVQLQFSGEVFDQENFIANNALFFTCVQVNDDNEFCSEVFDSVLSVPLPGPGKHKISAALCLSEGCLCNISTRVECCDIRQPGSNEEKLIQTFESILELENNMLDFAENTSPIAVSPPAWSCSGRHDVRYVIGIKSASIHAVARDLIRNSWMTKYQSLWETYQLCAVFIIGKTPYSEELSAFLQLEQQTFRDILLGEDGINVEDSYYTLHEKSPKFMTWILYYDEQTKSYPQPFQRNKFSENVRYVVMIDDDVYVRLPNLLHKLMNGPGKGDYRGEVFAEKFNHQYKPIRDSTHRNYVSVDDYPHTHFPSYATGNFYMLSIDLIEYIVDNQDSLSPVGTLEDVSVAYWLSKIAIFPKYDREVIAFSVIENQEQDTTMSSVCACCIYNVDYSKHLDAIEEYFQMCPDNDLNEVNLSNNGASLTQDNVLYFQMKKKRKQISNAGDAKSSFSQKKKKRELIVYVTEPSVWASEVVQSLLTTSFPHHSFQYFLVKSVNNTSQYQLPLAADHVGFTRPPDIFVISSIDEKKDSERGQLCHYDKTKEEINTKSNLYSNLLSWREDCQRHIQNSISDLNPKNVLFFNGEPISLLSWLSKIQSQEADVDRRNYVILNTYETHGMHEYINERNTNNVAIEYMPNAATSFANTLDFRESDMLLFRRDPGVKPSIDPNILLQPRGYLWAREQLQTKQRNVAYLYFRCDRLVREQVFSLLHAAMPAVDALGACNGFGQYQQSMEAIDKYVAGRFSDQFVRQAIKSYQPYKFVICFENTVVSGYVTEKLTNAFLAHAVPIYYGAPDVSTYFNPNAFINCRDFDTLDDCVVHVQEVNQNEDLYLSYLEAQPIIDMNKWCQFFQWQHDLIKQQCLQHSNAENNISVSIANIFKF